MIVYNCILTPNIINQIYGNIWLGAVHILCQPLEGGEGVSQKMTIADEGGREGRPKDDDC